VFCQLNIIGFGNAMVTDFVITGKLSALTKTDVWHRTILPNRLNLAVGMPPARDCVENIGYKVCR
jgi:hypothetical protein